MCYRGVIEEAEDVRSFLSETIRQNIRFLYILHWNILINLIIESVFPLQPPFLRIQRASIKNRRKSLLGVNENNTLSSVTTNVRSWRLMTHFSCLMAFQRKNEGQRTTGSYTAICPLIDDNTLKNIFIFQNTQNVWTPTVQGREPSTAKNIYGYGNGGAASKGQRIKKAAYSASFV